MTKLVTHLFDSTYPSAAENLACDEALLLLAEQNRLHPPILRLWESEESAVILGRTGKVKDEVHVAECRADGIPILRRCSGGGTVLIGPGCLLYSLVLSRNQYPQTAGIAGTTAAVLETIAESLQSATPEITTAGISDLVLADRKVSGNAQRWLRHTLLHHGSLLYDFDINLLARYLKIPHRQPKYRNSRPHREFLTNLPLSQQKIKRALVDCWNANEASGQVPEQLIRELVREKYEQDTWNFKL